MNSTSRDIHDIWPKYESHNVGNLGNQVQGGQTKYCAPTVLHLRHNPLALILYFKSLDTQSLHLSDKDFLRTYSIPQNIVDKAEEICDYYYHKLLTQKLNGTYRNTEYKRDLAEAIKLANLKQIRGDLVKLLYRLEDFYYEDQLIEQWVDQYKSYNFTQWELRRQSLTFVSKLNVFRLKSKHIKYFFVDSERNMYCVKFEKSHANNTQQIFDKFLALNNNTLCVTGHVRKIGVFFDYKFEYAQIDITEIH